MQIPTNHTIFQAISITKTSGDAPNWKTGQILQATVVSNVTNGLVNLRIGALILTAQIKAELTIGQQLTLEVISLGDKPLLQLIPQDKIQNQIAAALLTALSKQQSHAQLLSNLTEILSPKQLAKLPENIQAAIKQLYQSLPNINSLQSADGIKTAINNSGLFLEAKLAKINNSTVFNNDFKANLLRLSQAIQQHLSTSTTTIKPSSTAETLQTYTQTNLSSAPTSVRANYIFIRQHFTQAPPGTFLRTDAQQQITAPQVSAQSSTTSATTTTPVNRFFLPTTFSPTSSLTLSTASGQTTPTSNAAANPNTINTVPIKLILQHLTSSTNIDKRLPDAIVYPVNIPFRLNINSENPRPSANFSKLDSLAKILTFFLKDAEASLSRIQLNQLTHQNVEPELKPSWIFEIPIRNNNNIDLFQFKIEQENNSEEDDDEKNAWTIQISFNITELGQIYSNIRIHQKLTSITFWSEQKNTIAIFQQHMQDLQHELEDAGLIVDQLNCIEGCPPDSFNQKLAQNILDEKA